MSRYTDLRDEARADRYSPPDDLHYALEQAADDIQRLWDATSPMWVETNGEQCTKCPACSYLWDEDESEYHAASCPREALRPLFGEPYVAHRKDGGLDG